MTLDPKTRELLDLTPDSPPLGTVTVEVMRGDAPSQMAALFRSEHHMPNLEETRQREAKSTLLDDINHLTFVTADMDRLISFYERVFGARTTVDLEEEGLRHALIEVGPHTVLHPFQIPGIDPPGQQPMFERGRLDHFALNAVSEEAFRELHRRIEAEGALDSVVTDMGSMLLFSFLDPDDGRHEVVWRKPGVPVEAGLRQAEWKTVELH
jgi:catechol 2,3-dioxygenase-like lactoylglutathione lyase family enzyme